MRIYGLLLSLVLFLTSSVAFADCRAEANILFPLNANGLGANGSRWSSLLSVLNLSGQSLSSPGVQFITFCAIPEGCFTSEVPPHSFGGISSPVNTSGVVMRLSHDQAAAIAPSLRLFESTSQSTVDVPVLRDGDFRESAIWLSFVRTDSTVRTTLRIYQPDGRPLSATVTVYPYYSVEQTIGSATLIASQPSAPDLLCTVPSSASITMQNVFADVSRQNTYVNIKIEPQAPIERFWAFASATNNQTNQTQLISPN